MGSHLARPRRVIFSDANPVLPYDGPVCFPLLTILLHTAGRAMAAACRCPHGQQQIFSVGNNCIPLYSIIHLGFGAYLYLFSVLLPPSSLSHNSVTFPKKLVTGSHPARLHRVRSSDADPVPHHDGPVRSHTVAYSLLQDRRFVFLCLHRQNPIYSSARLTI